MSTGEQGSSSPQLIAPAKFRQKSTLVIVAASILLVLVWTSRRPEEPAYQGKPVSEWVRNFGESEEGTPASTQSKSAIREIGTNGIPTLLRMIQTPDSSFRSRLIALMEKQSLVKVKYHHPETSRRMALFALFVLEDRAKFAAPELLTIVRKGRGTVGREEAIVAIGSIGLPAKSVVPLLVGIASDVSDPNRIQAIFALSLTCSSAELVVTCLTSCISDADGDVRSMAADALIALGESAKPSVPSLITLLSDQSTSVRTTATDVLKRIDREAATKAGIP